MLNVAITPKLGRILDGHFEYRNQVKIRVDVERVGSSYKGLALGDLPSIQLLGNYLPDLSQLLLSATASCASCMMTQAADSGQRCDPHTFSLTPRKAGTFLSFDDYNTRYSRDATFKIPFRYRSPSQGQWSRCGAESLMSVFCLIPGSIYIDDFTYLAVFPSRWRIPSGLVSGRSSSRHR